ncbi:DUF2141 domain-containing protein [Piscinibacter sp.]|uniref:DUF2141 domain-containing protein n=1 Tax=Piscinibacter sp. TaxID=1903157 RepID=UPI002CCC3AC2|nr:DUF2141 domain-containing protein [Albitalea sp.]HUG25609.1 DUF2141 domain-containing protein [Albitalea sp.]
MTWLTSSCAAAIALAAIPVHAQTCAPIEVRNVRSEGMVMVAAYASADDYNKNPLARMQLRPDGGTLNFPLCGLSGPAVALTLFQDTNGNGQLDRNLLGIPSEPWGASGQPSAFEAPKWQTTQVPVNGSTIVVKLSQ